MDKEQALHHFWSSFGIPAYDENTVPLDAKLPYITYQVAEGDSEAIVPLTSSAYSRGDSWRYVNNLKDEVSKELPKRIKLNNGWLYLSKGTPFSMRMGEDTDKEIRRVMMNVMAQFITTD